MLEMALKRKWFLNIFIHSYVSGRGHLLMRGGKLFHTCTLIRQHREQFGVQHFKTCQNQVLYIGLRPLYQCQHSKHMIKIRSITISSCTVDIIVQIKTF